MAAAKLGFEPAMSLLPLVYQTLQRSLPEELRQFEMQWLTETVETDSITAGAELRKPKIKMYSIAVQTFRTNGGFNQFYAFELESIDYHRRFAQQTSKRILVGDRDFSIHVAATFADIISIKELLKAPLININEPDIGGYTPLARACVRGEWHVVELLLAHGANPALRLDSARPTCPHWIFQFYEICIDPASKALVTSGADINALASERLLLFHFPFVLPPGTPLHWAVAAGQKVFIEGLVELDADPFTRDRTDSVS